MKTEQLRDIHKVVLGILSDDEECRLNQPLLMAKALRYYNLPTDLFELAKITKKDYPGSIGRARRKVLEQNPLLIDRESNERRHAEEEEYKEFAHE